MSDVNVGDVKVLQAVFSVSEVATDPTTVTLKVKDPSGNTDSYTYAGGTVTKASTGTYTKSISLDEEGWWTYQWEAAGAVVAVEGSQFYVAAKRIA